MGYRCGMLKLFVLFVWLALKSLLFERSIQYVRFPKWQRILDIQSECVIPLLFKRFTVMPNFIHGPPVCTASAAALNWVQICLGRCKKCKYYSKKVSVKDLYWKQQTIEFLGGHPAIIRALFSNLTLLELLQTIFTYTFPSVQNPLNHTFKWFLFKDIPSNCMS